MTEFHERLEQALRTLPLRDKTAVQIINGDALKCLVNVVSADFEGMDEGDRQALVRRHLRNSFTIDELEQIEFIFTDAPSERSSIAQ